MPRRRIAMAQQTYVGPERPSSVELERASGWITFAGVMLIVLSIMNTIDGIAAIGASGFYVADARFIVSDLNTWGWVILGLGVLQMVVALGLFAGNQAARWAGVAIVALNAIAQLMIMPAYPFWALSIFAVDILVIYGLVAYGGRATFD
jgi:tetrahydromethanopterin S-methyltransferase subunit F